MGVIAAIILMGLLSFVVADPPSQQDYGLCSQIYIMHQYCSSQLSPTSTSLSQHPVRQPKTGKAGPRGPRGIVNYTAIYGKLTEKFSELEASMEENFTRWKNSAELKINEMKADLDRKDSEIRFLKKNQVFRNCEDAWAVDEGDGGVVPIFYNGNFYGVYCDMATDGGNWTVFQRRLDGSVDFYRTWEEYATGFGNKSGEFWLGLETIHQLTQDGEYELRVDLTDWDGSTAYAKYRTFSLAGRTDGYRLTVGGYSGTAGDSMTLHNGGRFSAKDKSFESSGVNCATRFHAAWWFGRCAYSSLNGRYNDTSDYHSGVLWYYWRNRWNYSLKSSEMKFRKK